MKAKRKSMGASENLEIRESGKKKVSRKRNN